MNDAPVLCVAVVVREPSTGRVLLLHRHRTDGTYDPWDDHWSLPGGRVEFGEHPERTAFRELHEETGLIAPPGSLRLLPLVTSQAAGMKHLVGIIYEAASVVGEFTNAEPDRHDAIGWFVPWAAPSPMMPGARDVLVHLRMEGCPL